MTRTKDKLEQHYMDDVVVEAKLLYPNDKPAQREYINNTLDCYLRDFEYQKMREIEDEDELDDVYWEEKSIASQKAAEACEVDFNKPSFRKPELKQLHKSYADRQRHINP